MTVNLDDTEMYPNDDSQFIASYITEEMPRAAERGPLQLDAFMFVSDSDLDA